MRVGDLPEDPEPESGSGSEAFTPDPTAQSPRASSSRPEPGAQLSLGLGTVHLDAWEDAELDEPGSPPLDLDSPTAPMFEFVTGVAGSGKTFAMRERARNLGGIVLCATTGIAAINAGGTTINSLLGYFDVNELREKFFAMAIDKTLRFLRDVKGVRRIVLDEASMLSGNALQFLVQAICDLNEHFLNTGDLSKVMRLTLCGDMCQLPPIKEPFIFEADCWEQCFDSHTIRLMRPRRHATNPDFLEALNHLRRGDGRSAVEFFAPLMVARRDDAFDGCTILAKNDEVDRYNHYRLAALSTKLEKFINKREGRQRSEWKNIPDVLELKRGCTVMLLTNDRNAGEYRYVNGDIATYLGRFGEYDGKEGGYAPEFRGLGLDAEKIGGPGDPLVKLHRTGAIRVVPSIVRTFAVTGEAENQRLQRKWKILTSEEEEGGKLIVDLGMDELLKRLGQEQLDKFLLEREGWVEYVPLRLAYASTVHKVQGLTLDHVQIALQSTFFANPGSCYVALSRARGVEGLRLVATPELMIARCKADKRVERFM